MQRTEVTGGKRGVVIGEEVPAYARVGEMEDLARWASVRNNEVNMEEKKKEKSSRAPGKATAEVCRREITGGSVKKRREERLTLSAIPGTSDEAEYDGEYAAPLPDWTKMAQGLSKVSAMLERMEELDKKLSGAKERGTPDDGDVTPSRTC